MPPFPLRKLLELTLFLSRTVPDWGALSAGEQCREILRAASLSKSQRSVLIRKYKSASAKDVLGSTNSDGASDLSSLPTLTAPTFTAPTLTGSNPDGASDLSTSTLPSQVLDGDLDGEWEGEGVPLTGKPPVGERVFGPNGIVYIGGQGYYGGGEVSNDYDDEYYPNYSGEDDFISPPAHVPGSMSPAELDKEIRNVQRTIPDCEAENAPIKAAEFSAYLELLLAEKEGKAL